MTEALIFLQQPEVLPFSAALALMLMIGMASLIGLDFDADFDPIGVDGTDADNPALINWLNPGRLPVLASLALFLMVYGLMGLGVQQVLRDNGGMMAPLLAGIAVAVPAYLAWMLVARIVGAIMPRDHSEAVNISSLVGRVGVVEVGTATSREPAKATFRDVFGTRHSMMVVMGLHGQEAAAGDEVRLIEVGRGGDPSLVMLREEREPISL